MKRQVVACMLTIGLGCSAQADDVRVYAPTDFEPRAPIYWNWAGFYLGGHWARGSADFTPGNATGSMARHILRDLTIENEAQISQLPQLKTSSTSGTTYGGFAGFNYQWEDVILGLELGYSFGRFGASATNSIGRAYTASDGYRYDVQMDSQASMLLKEYATLRARAGHVMGRFLPYAQVGGAIGRADISRSISIDLAAVDADPTEPPALPPAGLNKSASETKRGAFIYGLTAGAGIDIAVTPNIFVRGEYEYVHFFPFQGMTLDMHNARIGAAVKF